MDEIIASTESPTPTLTTIIPQTTKPAAVIPPLSPTLTSTPTPTPAPVPSKKYYPIPSGATEITIQTKNGTVTLPVPSAGTFDLSNAGGNTTIYINEMFYDDEGHFYGKLPSYYSASTKFVPITWEPPNTLAHTYQNNETGYSIGYPEGWSTSKYPYEYSKIGFSAPFPYYADLVAISVNPLKEGENLETLGLKISPGMKKIITTQYTVIGGETAKIRTYEYSSYQTTGADWIVVHKGNVYRIENLASLISNKNEIPDADKIVTTMVESFRFF